MLETNQPIIGRKGDLPVRTQPLIKTSICPGFFPLTSPTPDSPALLQHLGGYVTAPVMKMNNDRRIANLVADDAEMVEAHTELPVQPAISHVLVEAVDADSQTAIA